MIKSNNKITENHKYLRAFSAPAFTGAFSHFIRIMTAIFQPLYNNSSFFIISVQITGNNNYEVSINFLKWIYLLKKNILKFLRCLSHPTIETVHNVVGRLGKFRHAFHQNKWSQGMHERFNMSQEEKHDFNICLTGTTIFNQSRG